MAVSCICCGRAYRIRECRRIKNLSMNKFRIAARGAGVIIVLLALPLMAVSQPSLACMADPGIPVREAGLFRQRAELVYAEGASSGPGTGKAGLTGNIQVVFPDELLFWMCWKLAFILAGIVMIMGGERLYKNFCLEEK